MTVKVAVLVSGEGTNLQALIDAQKLGAVPAAKFCLVISSRADALAIEKAGVAGIAACVIERKSYANANDFDAALLVLLQEHHIEVLVLAGFLCILGANVLNTYPERIINVHPSLIPAFCGDGYYGLKVHEAALRRGVKITGATVHLVNEITDGGRILMQKAVEVQPQDTPKSLQQRVMQEAEWLILPKALQMLCEDVLASKTEDDFYD